MVIVVPPMQRIYELLAFVVALYFPVALVTWMVVDKFLVSSDGKAHVVRGQVEGTRPNRTVVDHSRRDA